MPKYLTRNWADDGEVPEWRLNSRVGTSIQ